MPQPAQQPVQQRRAVGYWAVFNTCWREQHKELGRRPTRSEVSRWYAANADGVWGDSKPTWLAFRDHAKCLRLTDDVKNYFKAYRNRKKSDGLAAKAPAETKLSPVVPSTLPLTLKTREESPPPPAPTAASIVAAAPTAKPEEKLPSTPSSHPILSDDALWAYNSGSRMLQHMQTFGPVHHYDAGSSWPPIPIESPLVASLSNASSQRTLSEHSPAGRTVSRGDFSQVADLHSLIIPSSPHSSLRRQLSSLPRQLSSLSPKSLHDSSRDVFSRPGPNPLKRTLSPDTPSTTGREKLSRSIFGRQPWPATSSGMVARTLSPTRLAGNVITTGMAVFAWMSDDYTSDDCSDDSSKNSTSHHPNGGTTPLREQHSVETGVKFELAVEQVVSTPQVSVGPAERPASCRAFLQEQCHGAVLDRQGSDVTRQIYVLAE